MKSIKAAALGGLVLLFVFIFSTANYAQSKDKTAGKTPDKTTDKTSAAAKTGAAKNVKTNAFARIWQGRTKAERADEYYAYLMEAGIPKFATVKGNLGVQVLRATADGITEFTVISYWESLEVIKNYAGEDITKTRHLPRDKEFLIELRDKVQTFEIVYENRKK